MCTIVYVHIYILYIQYRNNVSNNHVCIYSYCTYTSYIIFFSYLLEASLYETNDLGVGLGTCDSWPEIHL